MKLSAIIFISALSAAPAFAADWAREVNAAGLAAIEIPAAPAPLRAGPRDGQNYSGAEELLIKEFAVTEIGMDIPELEVMSQARYGDNAFCFEHALRQALFNLLENYSEPTSPLARTLDEMGVLEKPSKSDLKKARQKLLAGLNKPSALVAIVRPYKQNQPPRGEAVEKNWIFFFRIAGSPCWAIVDRSGEKAPYVYGVK
ncbi:MAG: hypothetical protein HY550_10470 [Elusimicrobia bacterium]|nr:hypothetical protein [Elusimicrobiota bacterium]